MFALIIPLDGRNPLPGFGGGWGSGDRPDNSLPPIYHPGHPDHGRPVDPDFGQPGGDHIWWGGGRPARPDNELPGAPVHPWLPGAGGGNRPDNTLPPGASPKAYGSAVATAPPATVDASKGGWLLVNVQGTLVWAWGQPPAAPPPTAGQPLPPTPEPKK